MVLWDNQRSVRLLLEHGEETLLLDETKALNNLLLTEIVAKDHTDHIEAATRGGGGTRSERCFISIFTSISIRYFPPHPEHLRKAIVD